MSIFDDVSKGISNDIDYIAKDVLGIKGKAKNSKGTLPLPWDEALGIPSNSRFFAPISIDAQRWDQLYPYRLVVIDTSKNNQVVGGNPTGVTVEITKDEGTQNSIVLFEPIGQKWLFRLPITPEQLSITDVYAINTSATLKGISEEHNGVVFKNIQASGTLGVWPYRETVTHPPTSPGLIRSLLGGTLEAVGNVVDQIGRTINTLTTGHPANKPITTRPELSSAGPSSTGYYQALALQQFLEQYAEAKKDPANAGWRLVFDIPKQNQSFVVTPVAFNWLQNANKPLNINYNFQLKGWRRIQLGFGAVPAQVGVATISPGLLDRILNTITQARSVAAASIALIGAVRSDVDKPLEILRQTSLFIKDLGGVAATAADLPNQIKQDYSGQITAALVANANNIKADNSTPSVRSSLDAMVANAQQTEGLSPDAVAGGQLGSTAATYNSIDPSKNVFDNPDENFELLDQVPLYSLNLTDAQQAVIQDLLQEIRELTVDDFKQFRATIQELALQISNYFGAGNAFYSQVYDRPAPSTRVQAMTVDEYDILKALYDAIQAYDLLTATTFLDDINKQTNMDYVAGLAADSGIAFNVPNSKVMVPVPFGLTIEAIAARYLGDAQRWIEIVTLNNLRDPYIDEDGFQLPLLSNATGRQITVSDVSNLYEGQRVVLRSSTQVPTARRILGIDRLSDTSYLLTLDGAPNLDPFVTADNAYLQAYLPGTVNSQQKIYIPSDQAVSNDPNVVPPSSTISDPLTGLSKVDWLLTDTGDIATNSYGDFRLASGITNLIQALKIKLGTMRGKLILHPQYGLGIKPGMLVSEFNVQTLYNDIWKMVTDDPRFAGIDTLQIQVNGPTLTINMGVILAGQRGVFPLTFDMSATSIAA